MPVKIFCCYAHEDEPLLNEFKAHLKPLEQQGLIKIWHDRDISAGVNWEQEIDKHLNTAEIILFLVSPDFMASDYCYGIEMKSAMERYERGQVYVIPVILRPCLWQNAPFSKLQALPTDAKPVTSWHNWDEAFFTAAKGIQSAITSLITDSYRVLWSVSSPGYLIFLLDQSRLMSNQVDISETDTSGTHIRICDLAATDLNRLLLRIIEANLKVKLDATISISPRAEVTILGYGNGEIRSLLSYGSSKKDILTLPELADSYNFFKERVISETNDVGNEVSTLLRFPIWVEPMAQGDAPMCAALQWARERAEQWVVTHPNCFPPIVINISSSMISDGDPAKLAHELCQVSTSDGHTLLYNICLTNLNHQPIIYPANERELPADIQIKQLFHLSSRLPKTHREVLEDYRGKNVPINAKGFIFNSNLSATEWILPFITTFGTRVARIKSI